MIVNGIRIEEFGREEFIRDRFHYRPGEHLTEIAPTQNGKTTLGFELLQEVSSPQLPGIVLAMKPRDPVLTKWGKRLGYKRVRGWPPPLTLGNRHPGYLVWPQTTFDPDKDDQIQSAAFRSAILHSYRRGNRIIVADELFGVSKELKLDRPMLAVWTRGSAMGVGLWSFVQKPTHVPLWAYNQAEHLFIGRDPDRRSRDRFGEIGGFDPRLVASASLSLRKYQWLYLGRSGPVMCIVRED